MCYDSATMGLEGSFRSTFVCGYHIQSSCHCQVCIGAESSKTATFPRCGTQHWNVRPGLVGLLRKLDLLLRLEATPHLSTSAVQKEEQQLARQAACLLSICLGLTHLRWSPLECLDMFGLWDPSDMGGRHRFLSIATICQSDAFQQCLSKPHWGNPLTGSLSWRLLFVVVGPKLAYLKHLSHLSQFKQMCSG